YKANWEGIPVEYIDPYHTSQICSKCGGLNKRTKHTYKCKSCGFEANADYNAGKNLQQIFLAKCQEEQASINSASNPTYQEPKAESDIGVRNIAKTRRRSQFLSTLKCGVPLR
ncbi:MAG: transposase, partial [Nanoarchaeota archaeon]|nr:transposase [Nanoarchaeota archaeon]